jgi:hypothetical protein
LWRATPEDVRTLEQFAVELERRAVERRELRAVELELSRAVSLVQRAGLPASSIIVGLSSRKEAALVTPHPARLTSDRRASPRTDPFVVA